MLRAKQSFVENASLENHILKKRNANPTGTNGIENEQNARPRAWKTNKPIVKSRITKCWQSRDQTEFDEAH